VKLLPLNDGLRQLEQAIPENHVTQRVPNYSPASANVQQGEVTLFTGCIANVFDTQTHNATMTLLNHLGYSVRVLQHQTCCGAVYAHNGEMEQAKTCARQNIDSIMKRDGIPLIFNSSGCGAFMKDYANLLAEGDDGIESRWAPTDIIDFLSEAGRLDELNFKPLDLKVAVHEPCSQRNILKNHEAVYDLLRKIPELEVIPLPENNICCGAGGTRMLTQPELANPLRDEKVKALEESGADILVSTNLACAMHLSGGIRALDRKISVMHVVDLLARQLA
jgi:glycolate oxidase iron-sulfur subunit